MFDVFYFIGIVEECVYIYLCINLFYLIGAVEECGLWSHCTSSRGIDKEA